jgi:hypothetical protein
MPQLLDIQDLSNSNPPQGGEKAKENRRRDIRSTPAFAKRKRLLTRNAGFRWLNADMVSPSPYLTPPTKSKNIG